MTSRSHRPRWSWRPLRRIATLGCVAAAWACTDTPGGLAPEGALDLAAPWTVVEPEAVGMSGGELFVATELAGRIDRLRSLVVVRHGRLALERYYGGATADSLADVRSVTKSMLSILVGIALRDGRIGSLDEPITEYLTRPRYPVESQHARIRIRHLLTMTSGFEWSEMGVGQYNDFVSAADPDGYLLAQPITSPPGTRFTYNSAAVHLLSRVLEEAVGMPVDAYADRVLFGRLGISRAGWERLLDGSPNGASGLDLTPRDLARLGQLLLQRGWSETRSIVPEAWMAEATSEHVAGLGAEGPVRRLSYGYLWWLDTDRDALLAWGYAGQFLYVVPALDLVVVATTDWRGVDQDIGSARLQQDVLAIIVERVLAAVD